VVAEVVVAGVAVVVAVVGRREQPRNGSTRSGHEYFAQWVNRKPRKVAPDSA